MNASERASTALLNRTAQKGRRAQNALQFREFGGRTDGECPMPLLIFHTGGDSRGWGRPFGGGMSGRSKPEQGNGECELLLIRRI